MRRALRWSLVAAVLWTVPAEAGWGPPAAVDRSRHGTLSRPQLVVSPSGTVAAVWVEWDDNQERLRYSTRHPGEGWRGPLWLSDPEPGIGQVALALDAHDNPTVVWTVHGDGGSQRLKATTVPFWSPSFPPATLAEDASSPSIAIDDYGTATVLFAAGGHGARRIGSVSRPAGGDWEVDDDLPANLTANGPTIVNRPGIGLTALWIEDGTALRSSDRGATNWSVPVTVDATAGFADVRVAAGGDLIAAWRGPGGVEVSDRAAGASWGAPVAVAAAPQAEGVSVARAASGDAAAIWTVDERAYASSRTVPGGWATPVALGPAARRSARVVLDAAGVATAAWESPDEAGARRATRAAGGAWAAPVVLSNAGEPGSAGALAIDHAGEITVAWVSAEPAPEGARSRLLSATTAATVIDETKILSGPEDGSYTRHDTATFTFNAGVDGNHCSDSLGATMCHSPWDIWLHKEGPHRFAVAVGTDATAATRTVHLDTTAPAIGITLAGAASSADRFGLGAKVDVSLHVTDTGSGVHSHTAPGPLFTGTPGPHRYTATARDNVGNAGKATFDYIVDPPPEAAPAPSPAPTATPAPAEPVVIPPRLLSGSRPTIAKLLRGGISARYRATTPGRLTVQWRAGRALLARGTTTITRAGTVTVRIRPTATGRRQLRKRKSVRLTALTVFRTGAATDTSTAMLTLRRGRTS
jgi:hypothetical protein